MRVGIITIHHVPNHGAVLQALALTNAIRMLGHDVAIIDFRPFSALKYYLKDAARSAHLVSDITRWWRITKYVDSRLPLSQHRASTSHQVARLAESFDALVCGSDQIWRIGFRGFVPAFFLAEPGMKHARRISYAPSAGQTTAYASPQPEQTIRESLAGFHAISARDRHTQALAARLSGKEVSLVLDPTFLNDWSGIGVERLHEPRYLLVYARLTAEQATWARRLADSRGLKLVGVGPACPRADRNFALADPEQWVQLFRHADFIVTNMFHGLALSLIFRKQFLMLGHRAKAAKVRDLLDRVGLNDRWVEWDTATPSDDVALIDYAVATPRLEAEVAESRRFLEAALS